MHVALAQLVPQVYTIDQVLAPYVYVFYASFLVAFAFTPIMRMVAMHYDIVDNPDRLRKMHQAPVAYLGGVAIFLGLLAGLAISQYLTLHRREPGWPSPHPACCVSARSTTPLRVRWKWRSSARGLVP